MYFSVDELQQFGVNQTMLHEYVTTQPIKKLLQHQAVKIERAYAVTKKFSKSLNEQQCYLIKLSNYSCEIAIVGYYMKFRKVIFVVLKILG